MKRLPVKYIRDKAKSAYKKDSKCKICGKEESLELHHFVGMTDLFNIWRRRNGIRIETDEDILQVRDQFIEEHKVQIYEDVVTLCKDHHQRLHQTFGKTPSVGSAKAQSRWVEKQRGKFTD